MPQDLAVYIHVPFCRQRCSYCHFDIKVFHPQTRQIGFIVGWLDGVKRELKNHAAQLPSRNITSIFFGGGTPSRLDASYIAELLDCIGELFAVDEDVEISMEINPEDVTDVYLDHVRAAGVNRISFGVQTFHDPSLSAINRAHDAQRARRVIAECPEFPKGRSLDLILGLPHQDFDTLEQDLSTTLDLDVDHVALYMLERDLPTPLDKKQHELPDEDIQADFYDQMVETFTDAGFDHYEISNFAKPGFACRHNLVYWRCGDYLGIGPAAHGRIGYSYYANHPQLTQWREEVEAHGLGLRLRENWSKERFQTERVIQGLRLSDGIPSDWVINPERLTSFYDHGILATDQNQIYLTQKGRLLANEVFQAFV